MILVAVLRRFLETWRGRYEPAAHYMRGPGPAYTAKIGLGAESDDSGTPQRSG